MKKLILFTLISFFFCTASFANNCLKYTTKQDTITVRDGSSYRKAIIIKERNSIIDPEQEWLAMHYPGFINEGQDPSQYDKRHYEIRHIKTSDGQRKDVYFDISSYFGKW